MDFFNIEAIQRELQNFRGADPFDHCVVDGFFKQDVATQLSDEFLDYDDPSWYVYQNAIEHKKALNNWNFFPSLTYSVFKALNSTEFRALLTGFVGKDLLADEGLHGGGWHIHGAGGNLNPHFDYSIHPKLGLQRKVNIIVYLGKGLQEHDGGHLGLWSNDNGNLRPGDLVKEVAPIFNRAVIFDTTQNSWHGMSRCLNSKEGIYRKSLAVYYLCVPDSNALTHQRALFAPRESQKGDKQVEELIKMRSDSVAFKNAYIKK